MRLLACLFLSFTLIGCASLGLGQKKVLYHDGTPVLYRLDGDSWKTDFNPSATGCMAYVSNGCPDVFVQQSGQTYSYPPLTPGDKSRYQCSVDFNDNPVACGQPNSCSPQYCYEHPSADPKALEFQAQEHETNGSLRSPDISNAKRRFLQRWEVWLEQNGMNVSSEEIPKQREMGQAKQLLPSGQYISATEASSMYAPKKSTEPELLKWSEPQELDGQKRPNGSRDYLSLRHARRSKPLTFIPEDTGWMEYSKESTKSMEQISSEYDGFSRAFRERAIRRNNQAKVQGKLRAISESAGECKTNISSAEKEACLARLTQLKNKVIANYLDSKFLWKIHEAQQPCILDADRKGVPYSDESCAAAVAAKEELAAERHKRSESEGIEASSERIPEKTPESSIKTRYEKSE